MDEERRLHVRLSAQQWSKLQYMFPECRVTIYDVEEYVREGEREMLNNTRLGAGWFEEYVSMHGNKLVNDLQSFRVVRFRAMCSIVNS